MKANADDIWLKKNQQYLVEAIKLVRIELSGLLTKERGHDNAEMLNELSIGYATLLKIENEMTSMPAIQKLTSTFNLSFFEKKIILLAAGVELDADLASIVQQLQGGSSILPNYSLVLGAFAESHWSALSPESPLFQWHLLKVSDQNLLIQSSFIIEEDILHYLTGLQYLSPKLKEIVFPITTFSECFEIDEISTALNQAGLLESKPLLQITGISAEEKMWMAAKACIDMQYDMYRLNPFDMPNQKHDLIDWVSVWNRNAALSDMVLYIDGALYSDLDYSQRHHLIFLIERIKGIVILGMDQVLKGLVRPVEKIELRPLSKKKQYSIWKEHLGSIAHMLNGHLDAIVAQFDLNASAIQKVSAKMLTLYPPEKSMETFHENVRQQLWQYCVEYTRPELISTAQRILPLAGWDDLVLPSMEKSVLAEIAIHVRQRQKVYDEWGFASKSNRGLGISALFAGESGTGKTMATEVLANELHMDLFRIDLSQVVNKYIGETEKNLSQIFDAAEGSGAILLFDEADALFGKRSEVKDSHDRYSNIEVSYLLQRMEEYKGLTILTTNMKNSLDKAFMRRIRFVIQFPFPDLNMRAEIWKRIFPSSTPTDGLDIQKLATLNIAGGNIRNIALHAAFMAAEKNKPVSMSDLQQAAKKEYLKLEKNMSLSENMI